jgi:repressor LexA
MARTVQEITLKPIERKALTVIRNRIAHVGAAPSVRELAAALGFSSPRSSADVIDRLIELGFLKRKEDRSLQLLRMPKEEIDRESTVEIPLVGSAPCGALLLAEENVQCMIPVSTRLARPRQRYFLLRAVGDSMTEAGIGDGSLVLVRQQPSAEIGDVVVALVDDEATIKELRRSADTVVLMPRSRNKAHKPIVLHRDFRVQGVVVATLPQFDEWY